MRIKDLNEILDSIDINGKAPENEPDRQYFYIKKARLILEDKKKELGRDLNAVVKTFGCPIVWVKKTL